MTTRFLNAEQYNEAICHNGENFNCFAGALSITDPPAGFWEFDLRPFQDIGKSFKELASKFHVFVNEVKSLEDVEGRYGFIVLGWFKSPPTFFSKRSLYTDFHVIRINPDGTFFSKPDRYEPARDLQSLDDPDLFDYADEIENKNYRVFVLED